ncbi:hypothetical protein KSF_038990 [Reticulibacter mediterranei]|uniref:HTH cro/C1-type domain-containing protein n=1 Tax=Reticulibacter mediterranei TaxID=2778369 RepID=A0A8J3IFW5_9CHLR|nr:helix-turn-helix transcriptional regulator [Reticulibacter mediterranei]GHO93851.1 hypothetical protein KSF_038990 [Reticulibacter mediterranei]
MAIASSASSVHPLKLARMQRNLSQQMLADFTGLSTPTIKRIESGKPARVDVRRQLCEYFGKTSEELGLYDRSEAAREQEEFAVLLRTYRKEMGWTQSTLAEKWSYSFETVSAWERGKRFPARTEIARLAEFLDMEVEEVEEIVIASKGGPLCKRVAAPMASHQEPSSDVASPTPFADGRLLWTLHLGVEAGRLQCRISCPLSSGEAWEMVLDPEMSGADIQSIYQIVQEHVMMQGIKQHANEQEVSSPKVLRFGPLAR